MPNVAKIKTSLVVIAKGILIRRVKTYKRQWPAN